MKTHVLFPVFLVVLGLAACGSDSPTAPTPPPATTPPTTNPEELMPTLSSIQTVIFNESCIEHHGGHAIEGDLDLSDGMSYAQLVNMPSFQVPSLDRVAPGDAENSYLIHKLEDRASIVGNRMPPAGLLTTDQIDIIKQWINDGAQNN